MRGGTPKNIHAVRSIIASCVYNIFPVLAHNQTQTTRSPKFLLFVYVIHTKPKFQMRGGTPNNIHAVVIFPSSNRYIYIIRDPYHDI